VKGGKVNESAAKKLWKKTRQSALGNRRAISTFPTAPTTKLDDRDHFNKMQKTSVASLRGLIDHPGTLIGITAEC